MAEYLHGAYGQINAVGARVATGGQGVIVYVGTAPVQTVAGGAENVNKPVVVNNIAEARKLFGYSEDYASYTLCEAMHVHFEVKGVGPLVFINVLDPAVHKGSEKGNVSLTPENGRVTIPSASGIVLDSIVIKSGDTTKKKGTDYTLNYNIDKQTITVAEAKSGSLGTAVLTITYDTVDPSKVTTDDVIGSTDDNGLNKGLYAVRNVYPLTGYIPAYIACPGFSSDKSVHDAMFLNSQKINGHWDAWLFTDLPITADGKAVGMSDAYDLKKKNGYTRVNETPSWPIIDGSDEKKYHLSVLRAANFQELLIQNDGIPFNSASNTDANLIKNLYLGEDAKGRVYDDELINEKLCQNGIASAAFISGRWVIWGAHSGDYNQENATQINVAETTRMMLYYISNDFQARRSADVDKPLSPNDIKAIVAEEQARLDALVAMGALTYGKAELKADADAKSDVINGDYAFTFNVTTTPLAKSLTAIVSWTDDGFVTYFE